MANTKLVKKIVGLTLGGAFGLSIGYVIGTLAKEPKIAQPENLALISRPVAILTVIPVLVLVLFLVIFLHEVGHALGGIAMGFKFNRLVTGPLQIFRDGDSIKIGLNRNASLAGGIAACIPQSADGLKNKMLFMVASGPLASLLLSISCLLLNRFYYFEANIDRYHSWTVFTLSLLVVGMGYFSALIFLVTVFPYKSAGFYSDGARMLNLLNGGANAEVDLGITSIMISSSGGTRPRDLDIAFLDKLLNSGSNSLYIVYGYYYKYYFYLDLGKLTEAEACLKEIRAREKEILPAVLPWLQLETAFLEAVFNKDYNKARMVFATAGKSALVEQQVYDRTEAAILLGENKNSEAKKLALKAIGLLPKSADAGVAKLEKDLLTRFVKSGEN